MSSWTGCVCRAPFDEVAMPLFLTAAEQLEWLEAHGVTNIEPDHMGRPSIPMADALRLRREADERSERDLIAAAEARAAHAEAVEQLRADILAAFLEHAGGSGLASPDGLTISVPERRAAAVSLGLTAAREVWVTAPFEVRVEVHHLAVKVGDETTSYDLAVVLPRATVEDAIDRAVARANRAAAL